MYLIIGFYLEQLKQMCDKLSHLSHVSYYPICLDDVIDIDNILPTNGNSQLVVIFSHYYLFKGEKGAGVEIDYDKKLNNLNKLHRDLINRYKTIHLIDYSHCGQTVETLSKLFNVDFCCLIKNYKQIETIRPFQTNDRDIKMPEIYNYYPISLNMKPSVDNMASEKLIYTQPETTSIFDILNCNNSPIIFNSFELFTKSHLFNIQPYITFTHGDHNVVYFLENLTISAIANNITLTIFAYDRATVDVLKSYPVVIVKMFSESEEKKSSWLEAVFHKLELTYMLLSLEKTVVYLDSDIVILENVINSLYYCLKCNNFDILIQYTGQNNSFNQYCTGFYLVKPNPQTVKHFKVAYEIEYFQGGDQHYFNLLIAPYLMVFTLPPWDYLVYRVYQQIRNLKHKPKLIHFNGFKKREDKIAFIKEKGYSLVDLKNITFQTDFSNQSSYSYFEKLIKLLQILNCYSDDTYRENNKRFVILTDNWKEELGANTLQIIPPICFKDNSEVVYLRGLKKPNLIIYWNQKLIEILQLILSYQ